MLKIGDFSKICQVSIKSLRHWDGIGLLKPALIDSHSSYRYYRTEEDLHTEHTYEMGGHLIFEHFFGPLGGEPFEAWSLRKYDAKTGKWEQRWVDTTPGGFYHWVGAWDAETNTFTGYAARYLDQDGQIVGEQAIREVFDKITDNSFAWRLENTADGGKTWTVTWTLDYTV